MFAPAVLMQTGATGATGSTGATGASGTNGATGSVSGFHLHDDRGAETPVLSMKSCDSSNCFYDRLISTTYRAV
jgi:hypothetical protein